MIYLDYAATTPLDEDVLHAMLPHMKESWGNASSPHSAGRQSRNAIEQARGVIADQLHVKPHEIVFTASGSEANTLALFGVCEKWEEKHRKTGTIIALSTEHSCSTHALEKLRSRGWNVVLLPVDEHGLLNPQHLQDALTEDTALVSVQWANNEVGTIQPVQDIAALCNKASIPFHTDAIQAVGQLPLTDLPDLTSIAAHKFYGPKGIAALIVRDHIELSPQVLGGGQEFGLRAGTEYTAGIIGMAAALNKAIHHQEEEHDRLIALRDEAIKILTSHPKISLNGHPILRLPNNINVHIDGVSGESAVITLDQQDICIATGSACATGATEPSHVQSALGKSKEQCMENVRMTLGRQTSQEDVQKATKALLKFVDAQ